MADETDESRTEVEPEEEEGGPVKTFLEHLEDLRWVLIKSIAALGVAVVVCLLAGNLVVRVLTWPLSQATITYPKGVQVVNLVIGTNHLGVIQLNREQQEAFAFSTNPFVNLELAPVRLGTNTLLSLRLGTNSPSSRTQPLRVPIISQTPAGAFLVAFKVALYAGLVASAPFIFFFVATFVFPALRMKEKKYVRIGLLWSVGLFMVGVAFAYFVLLPIALSASVKYAEWLGFTVPQWRAEEFISFVSMLMLGLGVGFEMPVVLLILVKIGILNYGILSKARAYVVVINFVVGGMLTPPDVISQVLMAIPLMGLYELTVWITWWWERKERRQAGQEAKA